MCIVHCYGKKQTVGGGGHLSMTLIGVKNKNKNKTDA